MAQCSISLHQKQQPVFGLCMHHRFHPVRLPQRFIILVGSCGEFHGRRCSGVTGNSLSLASLSEIRPSLRLCCNQLRVLRASRARIGGKSRQCFVQCHRRAGRVSRAVHQYRGRTEFFVPAYRWEFYPLSVRHVDLVFDGLLLLPAQRNLPGKGRRRYL